MKFLSKISPEWVLRISLGVMYLYSGMSIIRDPLSWRWAIQPLLKFMPTSMTTLEGIDQFLFFHGSMELALAVALLGWFLPRYIVKWATVLSILEFAGILILIPVDVITFRDIGLFGAFVALWLILPKKNK